MEHFWLRIAGLAAVAFAIVVVLAGPLVVAQRIVQKRCEYVQQLPKDAQVQCLKLKGKP